MLRDHPVIENLMATGWPDDKEPPVPHCPVCGAECDTAYKDRFGEIVGCDNCIRVQDAGECYEFVSRKDVK